MAPARSSSDVYDIIGSIQKASGPIAKKAILRKHPEIVPFLNLMFNPYITYGISGLKGSNLWPRKLEGTKTFKEAGTRDLLRRLETRELTGFEAHRAAANMLNTLEPKSAQLFDMILSRTPRLGIGVTGINQAFPNAIPMHAVQLCKTFDERKIKFPCIVEPKIDCIRGTWDGECFRSRNGLVIKGLSALEKEIKQLPDNEWDGELTVTGESFQVASGLLRSDAEVPNAHFNIFAVKGMPGHEYFERLFDWTPMTRGLTHLSFVQGVLAHAMEGVLQLYDEYRDQGYEGAVIKKPQYTYSGKRTFDWMKLKPLSDGEYDVVGVYEGEGRLAGMLGGIVVDFRGQQNRVGTGFSDAQRLEFWERPQAILNKKAHIEYMELTDDGNMRHSRFKDIRWDK